MDNLYQVYIRTDDLGRVTDIRSSAFLSDADGWLCIDEGEGDRFMHAQSNYLPCPLMDPRGVYRFKLINGAVARRTPEEMEEDYIPPEPAFDFAEALKTLQTDNEALKEALDLLLSGVVEDEYD